MRHSEQVVTMAAAFPDNNETAPVRVGSVLRRFPRETAGHTGLALAKEVAKLINERPADPFAGL